MIASKEVTILNLIESLQSHLLHSETVKRSKAVSILTQILEIVVPTSTLNDKETELLVEFFCSKLKDQHSILPPTLQGLLVLVVVRK